MCQGGGGGGEGLRPTDMRGGVPHNRKFPPGINFANLTSLFQVAKILTIAFVCIGCLLNITFTYTFLCLADNDQHVAKACQYRKAAGFTWGYNIPSAP